MDRSQVEDPPVYYGDRILVLKYLYLFKQPDRWDVVVFKSPYAPRVYNFEQNYIKRLIGKPNEAIMVLDGDVYIRAAGESDPRHFVVQPKPPHVQDALWRLVYDNDFRPQANLDRGNMRSWRMPWTVSDGTGWNLDGPAHGRIFTFDNTAGTSSLTFDPGANPTAQSLSDYLVYDVQPVGEGSYPLLKQPGDTFPNVREVPVSDLDLRATYQRAAGDGPLTLTLTKREHTFTAVLTPTTAALYHEVNGTKTQIGQTLTFARSERPMRVELSNADYQVTLRVDDRVAAQSTPAEFAPDLERLLNEYNGRLEDYVNHGRPPAPRVQIAAANQSCQLSHVSLWRDVYYYNTTRPGGSPLNAATPEDFPRHTQQLGPDEYFVMGDNSMVSLDARYWNEPIDLPGENLFARSGRVPGRFMLGKAFFVYWPAGFKPASNLPAFVPNFGDMRIIH
jgi:signal peptidase I